MSDNKDTKRCPFHLLTIELDDLQGFAFEPGDHVRGAQPLGDDFIFEWKITRKGENDKEEREL